MAGWHINWSHKATEHPAVSQFWASICFTGLEERWVPFLAAPAPLTDGGQDGVGTRKEESAALQVPLHMVLLRGVPVQLCLSPCLLPVGLQEGVLVAVQIVHQVPIAAVLSDDIDGPWLERAPMSALPQPPLTPQSSEFHPTVTLTRLQDI